MCVRVCVCVFSDIIHFKNCKKCKVQNFVSYLIVHKNFYHNERYSFTGSPLS